MCAPVSTGRSFILVEELNGFATPGSTSCSVAVLQRMLYFFHREDHALPNPVRDECAIGGRNDFMSANRTMTFSKCNGDRKSVHFGVQNACGLVGIST
jgi:hypothetical protein